MPTQSFSNLAEPPTAKGDARPRPLDEPMRMLVRHQWVRDHDNPRVTVLAGPLRSGCALWEEWLALTGRGRLKGSMLRQPPRANPSWLEGTASRVVDRSLADPREPLALSVESRLLMSWLSGRQDRLAALVREGLVTLGRGIRSPRKKDAVRLRGPAQALATGRRARSLAEFAMFEALESTPSTSRRFELNGLLSIDFGGRPAEVDLLSRVDKIAIEIDGYHHFVDETSYRRDRRKDLVLQASGYAVLRFLATDILADPSAAIRMVVELIGQRRRNGRLER